MICLGLLLGILSQIDIFGYVETRPYLSWNDSVSVYGYSRGWLELSTRGVNYGTQIAFDCVVPYDTISSAIPGENLRVPRLALWLGPEDLRITAGKQRLYWGVAKVFRPLDVFNPVNFLEPGHERIGSSAILGYASIGDLTNLRGIYRPQYDLKRSFSGLRLGTNLVENDIGLTIMHRSVNRTTIVGGEIVGDLAVGYWSELSHTWEDTTRYVKTCIGLDYTFHFPVYGMVEFFYDGSGEPDPDRYDYAKILSGQRAMLGQQYLYVTIGAVSNPFFRPSVSSVVNLDDGGIVLIPQVYYSVLDNVELTFGLNLLAGSSDSEFRTISPFQGQIYVWSRAYF